MNQLFGYLSVELYLVDLVEYNFHLAFINISGFEGFTLSFVYYLFHHTGKPWGTEPLGNRHYWRDGGGTENTHRQAGQVERFTGKTQGKTNII